MLGGVIVTGVPVLTSWAELRAVPLSVTVMPGTDIPVAVIALTVTVRVVPVPLVVIVSLAGGGGGGGVLVPDPLMSKVILSRTFLGAF